MKKKVTLGPQCAIAPMPALLVGSMTDGKPNFMTAAWSGIVNSRPPMLSVSFQHHRHTLKGLKETGAFSVNVPHESQVREVDYCGIVSGVKEPEKAKTCGFTVFFGALGNAPLIAECPVNLECRVVHILNLGSHACVIGEIVETHVSEDCLTDGDPDPHKISPVCFTFGKVRHYHRLGETLGRAWHIGLEVKKD